MPDSISCQSAAMQGALDERGVRNGLRLVVVLLALVMLAACKTRDPRDRAPEDRTRARPAWVDVEPGGNRQWIGRGQSTFDDPVGQVRAPLRAEALARQDIVRHIRQRLEGSALVLIESATGAPAGPRPALPDRDASSSATPLGPPAPPAAAHTSASDVASHTACFIARTSVVVDRWFDAAARTWHVLVAAPLADTTYALTLELRRNQPALRDALFPVHLARARMTAPPPKLNDLPPPPQGPGLDEAAQLRMSRDMVWPPNEPSEPGRMFYGGAQVHCGRNATSLDVPGRAARVRLAQRVGEVVRLALESWVGARSPGGDWLSGAFAEAVSVAAGCDAAEAASVVTMTVSAEDAASAPSVGSGVSQATQRSAADDYSWLLNEFGAPPDGEATAGRVPWYAPHMLCPRRARMLLQVPMDAVQRACSRRLRQAAEEANRPLPMDTRPTTGVPPVPDDADLRSLLDSAQGRLQGHRPFQPGGRY
ncbi:MAG: hypothetical protein AB7K09_03360 [Planctomycetota bacterium]